MRLILREEISEPEMENLFNSYPPPSLPFCQLVVKLAARLMFSLKDRYSLKDLCGGTVEFGNADRTLRVLVHILLPLCIRLGIGAKGKPINSVRSFVRSFIHPFIIYMFICFLFTCSFIRSIIRSFVHSSIHSFIQFLNMKSLST